MCVRCLLHLSIESSDFIYHTHLVLKQKRMLHTYQRYTYKVKLEKINIDTVSQKGINLGTILAKKYIL